MFRQQVLIKTGNHLEKNKKMTNQYRKVTDYGYPEPEPEPSVKIHVPKIGEPEPSVKVPVPKIRELEPSGKGKVSEFETGTRNRSSLSVTCCRGHPRVPDDLPSPSPTTCTQMTIFLFMPQSLTLRTIIRKPLVKNRLHIPSTARQNYRNLVRQFSSNISFNKNPSIRDPLLLCSTLIRIKRYPNKTRYLAESIGRPNM